MAAPPPAYGSNAGGSQVEGRPYPSGSGVQQHASAPPPPPYYDIAAEDLEAPHTLGSSAGGGRAPPFAGRRSALTIGDAPMGTSSAVRRACEGKGIVLPSPPTDLEKVLYQRSGRVFLLFFTFFAAYATCGAMVLFSASSPFFYFFAIPTAFAIVYLSLHYCGVSVWGKDFDPQVHSIVKASGERYSPTVDVFLPVCNEPIALLKNSWSFVAALDYPHFLVHVLDDGAGDEVKDLAAAYGFQYIRRTDRPALRKAGNIRHAFSLTSGEAFVIFDADFCPRQDFLRETLPYLADPSIGILQTPQFFRRRNEQTWVEQGAGVCQELFYRMEQVNLDRFNAALCAGSCAVYRRAAVEVFGGAAPIDHSEDMFTGFEMTRLGRFKVKYVPICLATGTCPDDPRSFFMQQYRWCMGILHLVPESGFWASNLSGVQKLCFFNGLLYYLAPALFIFLGPTPILLQVWAMPRGVLWTYIRIAMPPILFSCIILPCWSRQDGVCRQASAHRVRVIRSYAHLYAIKDHIMGTVDPWVPSNGGASRSTSLAYSSSVVFLVCWNIISTLLIVGGAVFSIVIWESSNFLWYDFIFPVGLAVFSCVLNLSTLWP